MLQRWDVGRAFVEYEDKDGGKRRPVLIINVSSEQCITFKITKNLTRDDYLEYKIIKWQDAGLDCPSCVRLGHKVYFSDFDNVIKIGRLQKQDIDNIKILCQKFEIKLDEKLIQSSSNKALQQNIKTEIDSGKSPKQAAAIAYSIQRKNESMDLKESTSINIQELVAEIVARMEDHLEYSNNVTTDIEFELPTTNNKEIKKIFALLNDMSSDKYIDYEVEDEQTYPGATYYYASLSRKYPDDYYFDYEDPETEDAQPGQRTGKYKISYKSLKSHNEQELEEQLSSEGIYSKGYMDKYSHLFSDFDALIKKLYNYLNIENNDKLKSEIEQHKDTLKIGSHVLDLISDDGEANTYKDQQAAIDKLKAIIESLGYNVLRTRWAQSGSRRFGQIVPYVIFYIDFKKDNNQELEEDMGDKTYAVTVKYHNEPARIEARLAKDRKDLEYQLNTDDEVEWYDFDEKQFISESFEEIVENKLENNYNINEENNLHPVPSTFDIMPLSTFKKDWKHLGLGDSDLNDLKLEMKSRPPFANLGSGVYKFRFAPRSWNSGKSGASRVIYIEVLSDTKAYLVTAYRKNEKGNLSKEELNTIRSLAKQLGEK